MKKSLFFKLMLLVNCFVLCLITQVSFADSDEQKTLNLERYKIDPSMVDYNSMTFEEKSEWVKNNTPVTFHGKAQKSSRGEWLETETTSTIIESVDGDLAKLTTRAKFMCDDDYTKIIDISPVVFRFETKDEYVVSTHEENFLAVWEFPDHARGMFRAKCLDFATGTLYVIEHWYYFYGWGDYYVHTIILPYEQL